MKTMTRIRLAVVAFMAVCLLAVPCGAVAGEATTQVKASIDEILGILKDPSLKGPRKTVERRQQMMESLKKLFGFEEMAKRSMGRYWRERTEKEKEEFTVLFTKMIEQSYIDKVEKYTNEKIVYDGEKTISKMALVKTKVITAKGTEIPIDYKLLRKDDGKWLIYDVVIEGVSLVSNYRSQFKSVLTSKPYSELVRQIKAKL